MEARSAAQLAAIPEESKSRSSVNNSLNNGSAPNGGSVGSQRSDQKQGDDPAHDWQKKIASGSVQRRI